MLHNTGKRFVQHILLWCIMVSNVINHFKHSIHYNHAETISCDKENYAPSKIS